LRLEGNKKIGHKGNLRGSGMNENEMNELRGTFLPLLLLLLGLLS
jgi:hypothetical protein